MMAPGTDDFWGRLAYDDPRELTLAVLARIGITVIQALKVRYFARDQVHAVKYRDHQGQTQLAFCRLQQQEAGIWCCSYLTFGLSYQEALIDSNNNGPYLLWVPVGLTPFCVIGGYILDPLATASKVCLVNEEGQTIEDSVEDEMVLFLFDRTLFKFFHTQVTFYTAEGTFIASHQLFLDKTMKKRRSFSPPSVWAWPDPRQAAWHFLSTLSYYVKEQDLAREGSVQIIKEQSYLHHYGYVLGYEDLQGEQHICFCGVSEYNAGVWFVTRVCWDRYLTTEKAELEQKPQPWMVFWPAFPEQAPPSLYGRSLPAPLGVGMIVDNGFHVAYVHLLDGTGKVVLADTVKNGLVLFLSEHLSSRWLAVELYNQEGILVGAHNVFNSPRGKVHPPQGRYDPGQTTVEFVIWLGASDIRISKIAVSGETQWHAVTYTDPQGEQRRCLCTLSQQESGHWYVSGTLFWIQDDDDNLMCWVDTLQGKVGYWACGYFADGTFNSARARLIDSAGCILEDRVEDGFVLFTTTQPLQEPLRVELDMGTQTPVDASLRTANWLYLAPRSPARPDPQQAIVEALIDFLLPQSSSFWIVGMLLNGMIATEESIQVLKQSTLPCRQLYAIRYTDKMRGEHKRCFCLAGQCQSGLWLVRSVFWETALASHVQDIERDTHQPWLDRFGWFEESVQPPAHYLFLYTPFVMAGRVVRNGFVVTRVRLIDGQGLELEDTVEDDLVLFLSERPVLRPIIAQLYDSSGRLLGQQTIY